MMSSAAGGAALVSPGSAGGGIVGGGGGAMSFTSTSQGSAGGGGGGTCSGTGGGAMSSCASTGGGGCTSGGAAVASLGSGGGGSGAADSCVSGLTAHKLLGSAAGGGGMSSTGAAGCGATDGWVRRNATMPRLRASSSPGRTMVRRMQMGHVIADAKSSGPAGLLDGAGGRSVHGVLWLATHVPHTVCPHTSMYGAASPACSWYARPQHGQRHTIAGSTVSLLCVPSLIRSSHTHKTLCVCEREKKTAMVAKAKPLKPVEKSVELKKRRKERKTTQSRCCVLFVR